MPEIPEPGFSEPAVTVQPTVAGHDTPRCGASKRQGTGTCTQVAGWGTSHPGIGRCKLHGGTTPSHVANAQQEQARELLGTLGVAADPSSLPPVVVYAELQLSAAKHLAAVRWLEQQVQALPAAEVPTSPWPKLLVEHRRESDRLLVSLAGLGIDLAMVRLEREKADAVARVLSAVLTRLGLDPAKPDVVKVVTSELLALEGAPS